jgi:2-polyprenyl-3-methyl-5-hydroxy-6-metoxy-1,4-benzoquinol methylase
MVERLAPPAGERWDVAPPEVERLEADWWGKYAWLENDYAWVHPPEVRKILRSHYLRGIVKSVPKDETIIDFGCGAGWLSILLYELGARHVIGVDNSSAQIAIAKQKAAEAGLAGKIDFIDTVNPDILKSAHALIIHGVLHHLAGSEIESFSQMIAANVSSGSKIFILEPVMGSERYMMWSLPYKLLEMFRKLRGQGPEELKIRAMLDSRGDGPRHPGYGVSPKERPFRVGELERRLEPRFKVTRGKPVLLNSVRVATELLLMAETKPKTAKFLMRFGLGPYMLWERLSFLFAPKRLWNGWVFCLFEATPAQ